MALRHLHKALAPLLSGPSLRSLASAPSIFDYIVHFTVIDTDGSRRDVKALEGTSVACAMFESGLFSDQDIYTRSLRSYDVDSHVYVSADFLPLVSRLSPEEEVALDLCADEQRSRSVSFYFWFFFVFQTPIQQHYIGGDFDVHG